VREPAVQGQGLRQQRGGVVGLPLQGLVTEPKPREVITIYEIDAAGERNWAKACLQLPVDAADRSLRRRHKIIDYPGVPVDHTTVQENHGVLKNVRIRSARTSG
jgi:hypothetical protein